jgi:hypothetical protein
MGGEKLDQKRGMARRHDDRQRSRNGSRNGQPPIYPWRWDIPFVQARWFSMAVAHIRFQ